MLSKLNFAPYVVFLVLHHEIIQLFDTTRTKKGPAELVGSICCLNNCSILELEFSLALVSYSQRINSRADLDVVVPTESIAFVRSVNEEIADWRMVGNLLLVNFCSIFQIRLKSLA